MAAPFLDIERLGSGVDLINDYSETLGEYIANIEFKEGTYVAENGAAKTRFNWSGSIANLHFDIDQESGVKFSQYKKFLGLENGAKGQFYWPAGLDVTGLDNIVKGGFETITPTSLDPESSTNQTLNLSLSGEGDIDAPFWANLNGEITVRVEGVDLPKIRFSNNVPGDFNTGTEHMKTVLEVPIEYDEESKIVSIGKYNFSNFDFSPDLSNYWALYYDVALKPVADLWDDWFRPITDLGGHVPNPIKEVDKKVAEQIASGDDIAKKELGKFISDQVNSSGVKPYVDASFMPLLKYSWNDEEYPAKFIDIEIEYDTLADELTGTKLVANNNTYSHAYEDASSPRMKNLDNGKSARFTFFLEENFTRKNADKIANFSEARGDEIALSAMKFDGIEDINYTQVKNKKQFRRAKRGKANIIGYERSNRIDLYFDENAGDRGLGDGGIFSVLRSESEELPMLVSSDFVVI